LSSRGLSAAVTGGSSSVPARPPSAPCRGQAARPAGDRGLVHPDRAVPAPRPLRRLAHRPGRPERRAHLHRGRQGADRRGPPRRRAARAPHPRGARLLERDAARPDVADGAGDGGRRRPDRGAQGDRREAGAEAVPPVRGTLAARLPARPRRRGAGALRRLPRARGREPVTTERAAAERLAGGMDARALPGRGEPLTVRFITGGASNELFEIRRGDARLALRRPPAKVPEGRNESMLREYRVLAALRDTDVPHPRVLVACEDPSVVGACFYLMEYVDGWSCMSTNGWPSPFDADLDARCGLAWELVDAIAKLACVDWRARGLEGFGGPGGVHERQAERW